MALHLHRPAEGDPGAAARFALVALTGLAAFGPAGPGCPDLALELGLSAWMRMAGVGTAEARATLSALREAVLAAAGLDRAAEPVPFVGPGPETGHPGARRLPLRPHHPGGPGGRCRPPDGRRPGPRRARRLGGPESGSAGPGRAPAATGHRVQISSTDRGVRRSMTEAATSRTAPITVNTRCHQLK